MTEQHLNEMKETHEMSLSEKEAKIEEWQQQVAQLNEGIGVIDRRILDLQKMQVDETTIKKKQEDVVRLQTQLQQKMQILNKDMLFLMNNETCPTCHQVIDATFKENTIKEKKEYTKEIEEALGQLNERFSSIHKQLADFENLRRKEIDLIKVKDRDISASKNYITNIKTLRDDIDHLENRIQNVNFSQLDKLKEDFEKIVHILKERSDDRSVMGYASVLLKDTGIKAKIIKTFLPEMNQLISKYMAALDFFAEFTLDETFEEKIKSRYRDEFSYNSFSEGEKIKIDVALLFAWRAIARRRASIDINLLVLDEIFDTSMDGEGVDEAAKLLLGLTSDENVFIISHKDQMVDRFDNVIHFVKNQNFSRIVE